MKHPTPPPRPALRTGAIRALALTSSLFLASCGSDGTGPPEPDPGILRAVVTQAPAGSGGVLLEIGGPGVGPATAVGAYRLWQTPAGSTPIRVLVKGSVVAGPLVQFTVPDRNDSYTVRVLDAAAAAGGGYARQLPTDYRVEVRR